MISTKLGLTGLIQLVVYLILVISVVFYQLSIVNLVYLVFEGERKEKKRNEWCLLVWNLSYHGNRELLIACQYRVQ